MSIIGIDIGSSTTKIVEFKGNQIKNKAIIRTKFSNEVLEKFIINNNIQNVEQLVFTGIGASKVDVNQFKVPVKIVDEFTAISKGGLYLTGKKEAFVVSVGTGTAFIEVTKGGARHMGGTGVGAGMLFNMCNKFLNIESFDEIVELSKKGDITKIDLRIGDITNSKISTLPNDMTLSNFGKFENDYKKEDIVVGLINMIFEVIGMMVVFMSLKSNIKEVILIGNITALPGVRYVLDRIQKIQNIKFIVPEDTEFAVVIGAIQNIKQFF